MTLNPFHWGGATFVYYYAALILATILWTLACRSNIGPAEDREPSEPLDEQQIAWLADGPDRAADVMLLPLLDSGTIEIQETGGWFNRGTEFAVTGRLPATFASVKDDIGDFFVIESFRCAVDPILDRIEAVLERRGLAPDDAAAALVRRKLLPAFAGLFCIGVAELLLLGRYEQTVAHVLWQMVIAVAITEYFVLKVPPRLTRAGRLVLAREKASFQRQVRKPLDSELPLAFALSGRKVLRSRGYDAFYQILTRAARRRRSGRVRGLPFMRR